MNALQRTPALAAATNEIVGSKLESGAMIQFTIPTRSMLPSLKPGDRVFARGIRPDEPRIGDILLLRSDRYFLAHRLIERRLVDRKLAFVTQGDYGTEPDGLWSAEQICGKIVTVQRDGREQSLESTRARWLGALIALLLRWRTRTARLSSTPLRTIALRIDSTLVRSAAWLVVFR